MLDELELFELATVVRDVVLLTHAHDSCIFSTRLAIGALRHYGVVAEPWPCEALFLNWPAAEHLERVGTLPPVEEQPDDFHVLGLGIGDAEQVGHLVARIPSVGLVDPSIDQAHRPAKAIDTTPARVLLYRRGLQDDDGGNGSWTWRWTTELGVTTANYRERPDRRRWRGSADWSQPRRYRPSLAEVLRRLREP